MRLRIRLLTLLITLISSVAWQAGAQATSGAISGIVMDERQAVIANATVTARNVGTNESRTVITDGTGSYRIPNLAVGNYEITIQARGFAKMVRSGVELLLNQDAVVNVSLKASELGGSDHGCRERFAAEHEQL